jgi:hypothetical protein
LEADADVAHTSFLKLVHQDSPLEKEMRNSQTTKKPKNEKH